MVKKKKKKKKKIREEEKPKFPNKKLIIISAVLTSVIVLGFIISFTLLHSPEVKFSLKAAIVDQIGENPPSDSESMREFNETVTKILEDAGFNVSYHKSKSVTVKFYESLAKYNYGLIILRAHSALRKGQSIVDFFTSEKFVEGKYPSELVTAGYYEWEKNVLYCAITPEFIKNIDGDFPKSVIIAMGCNSLNKTCTGMAEAFIQKGAKVYIGWTGLVDLAHADNETIKLLKMLLNENKTVADAVHSIYRDPHWLSKMDFYPSSAGSLKISDLIASVKTSMTLQITFATLKQESNLFSVLVLFVVPQENTRYIFSSNQISSYNSVLKQSCISSCEVHHRLS